MRLACCLVGVLALSLSGCSDEQQVSDVAADAGETSDVATVSTEYTDWSPSMSGTTAKPAYGKGCRYKAVDGELWTLASDGANDTIAVSGEAAGPIALNLRVVDGGGVTLMAADGIALSRVLTGKSYYEASGTLTFESGDADPWTILDGTLCFESKLTEMTSDVAGEFSLIAQHGDGGEVRTAGGTFVLPAAAVLASDPLNVTADTIAFDLQ